MLKFNIVNLSEIKGELFYENIRNLKKQTNNLI